MFVQWLTSCKDIEIRSRILTKNNLTMTEVWQRILNLRYDTLEFEEK